MFKNLLNETKKLNEGDIGDVRRAFRLSAAAYTALGRLNGLVKQIEAGDADPERVAFLVKWQRDKLQQELDAVETPDSPEGESNVQPAS